jgi:hypothetical protein
MCDYITILQEIVINEFNLLPERKKNLAQHNTIKPMKANKNE